MLKLQRPFLALIAATTLFVSCGEDDGGVTAIPLRDVSEVATEDDMSLQDYLSTHFYNYEEFQSPAADFDYKVIIDTIEGVNAGKTPLIDQVQSKISKARDVDHTLYYLIARQGAGEKANFSDSTLVSYEGKRIEDKELFDLANQPIWFDLVGNPIRRTSGVIDGFRESISEFRGADSWTTGSDNVVQFNNFGSGAVFMPSGLAYFNGSQPGRSYAPIVFTMNVMLVNEADHDNDGIPSYLEDVDNDRDINSDDTDSDRLPDYIDSDDDGDGKTTRSEIEDADGNIIFPYPDTDGDGTPDYLDSDS